MSKTRDILRLFGEGLSRAEIARQLNCTAANVSLTLKRHGEWDHTVSAIPPEHMQWLVGRARLLRRPTRELAARLLMEIIDMYKTGDC